MVQYFDESDQSSSDYSYEQTSSLGCSDRKQQRTYDEDVERNPGNNLENMSVESHPLDPYWRISNDQSSVDRDKLLEWHFKDDIEISHTKTTRLQTLLTSSSSLYTKVEKSKTRMK